MVEVSWGAWQEFIDGWDFNEKNRGSEFDINFLTVQYSRDPVLVFPRLTMATVLASVDTNHGDMVRCVLLFTSNLGCTQLLLDVNVTDSRRATRLL
jgi:hypothetical protein